MAEKRTYDVVIVGAGPGGYVAAIRAAQLGLKAAVIERDRPGGVCLNMGCIPSKALIHQAELFRSIPEIEGLGVTVDVNKFSYAKVFAKSRKASDMLSRGVEFLLKKNKIDLFHGEAVLKSPQRVALAGGEEISGKNILIATGSRPRSIPGFDFDGSLILSSDHALMLEELPQSAAILGGGAIGVEFAHIWNAFGVEVHLVEMMDQLLPLEDREVVEVLARSFKKRGIKIYTATRAAALEKAGSSVTLTLEGSKGQQQLKTDKVLVVVGRAPNTENLGLEGLGLKMAKGNITVGDYYQSSIAGVYAIGDIVATPMLAHVASKEGEIVVEHLAGHQAEPGLELQAIPSAVYCEPQIASFGYSEAQAKNQSLSFEKAVFPYRGAGKAVAVGKSEGLVKILFQTDSREIIGAHIVGADATELIHELLLAKTAELLPEDLARMIHAHPTLSEAVMEAARTAEGWAIHA